MDQKTDKELDDALTEIVGRHVDRMLDIRKRELQERVALGPQFAARVKELARQYLSGEKIEFQDDSQE